MNSCDPRPPASKPTASIIIDFPAPVSPVRTVINGPVVATLIRKMDFPTVFTTIGDDGNVLVVCMSPEAAIKLEEKLNAMLD